MSSRAVRAVLLVFALVLTSLAWSLPAALAACGNGTTQWVRLGGICCLNKQKWKSQSCIFGVWTDNGATKCEGSCAF